MKLFPCILVFAFLLALSESDQGAKSVTTTATTSAHPTTPTVPPTQVGKPDVPTPKLSDSDNVRLVLDTYTKLLESDDKVMFAKNLIPIIEAWVKEWEGNELPKSVLEPGSSSPTTTSPQTTNSETTDTTTTNTTTTVPITTQTNPTTTSTREIPDTAEATTHPNNNGINAPQPEARTEKSESTHPTQSSKESKGSKDAANKQETKHFYQSSVFFFLIFSSIVTVFGLYFGYMSRRKIKAYIYKNFGIGRNAKPYTRVPTLEDAMPSFADVKN